MQFYSALSLYVILQDCVKNLERSENPNDPSIVRLKNALLLRIRDVETPELKSRFSPRSTKLG